MLFEKYDLRLQRIYSDMDKVLLNFVASECDIGCFREMADIVMEYIRDDVFSFEDLSRDGELSTHLINVAMISGWISRYKGLSEDETYMSVLGGIMHDIGKLYIPMHILNKPGKLTRFETIAVSAHTSIGFDIASTFTSDSLILNVIANHHKHIKNLKNPVCIKEFPLEDHRHHPLVCAIADITDAVVCQRPYKKKLPLSVARNDLFLKGISDIDVIYSFMKR